MKYRIRVLLQCLITFCCHSTSAQVYNTGMMYVPDSANVAAFGDFSNVAGGAVTNAGNIYAFFGITNGGATGYDNGTLHLRGQTAQVLDGNAPFFTSNLQINNTGGSITLHKRYSVSNQVHFVSGIVHAPLNNEPLEFNPGGNSGAAIPATGVSDTSHIEGYTSQTGTGYFIYPVGNDTHYQPVAVNLSQNTAGMLCRYIASDAGDGPFPNTGLSNTPLEHYNIYEYWDLSPAGSATGSLTLYYDGYNDFGIGTDYSTALKVAHKTPSGWSNEGGIVNGTQNAGMVTTIGEVSTWDLFTLGSISSLSPLPNGIINFEVKQDKCNAILSWHSGVENDLAAFDIQYSTDGVRFKTVGSVSAKGSENDYAYSYTPMNGRVYFRLVLRSGNGDYNFSQVLMLHMNCKGSTHSVTVYPNPVTFGNKLHISLSGYKGSVTGILYEITGRPIYVEPLANGINTMDTDKIAAGAYQLCILNEGNKEVYKIVVTQ